MVNFIDTLILLLNLSVVFCYTVREINNSVVSDENSKDHLNIGNVLVENEDEEFEIKEADLIDDETFRNGDDNDDKVSQQEVRTMKSALQKVRQKYYCSAHVSEESYLLMYGTKSWSFPRQTVNLTLAYPSDQQNENDYFITEFEVMVYIDGGRSRAYLTSGGLMKDKISLYVVSEDITFLSFQFKVYGIEKVSLVPEGRFQYQCG